MVCCISCDRLFENRFAEFQTGNFDKKRYDVYYYLLNVCAPVMTDTSWTTLVLFRAENAFTHLALRGDSGPEICSRHSRTHRLVLGFRLTRTDVLLISIEDHRSWCFRRKRSCSGFCCSDNNVTLVFKTGELCEIRRPHWRST